MSDFRVIKVISLCILVLCFNVNAKESASYHAPNKVVAVGDIHGAYSRFHNLLRELKLIDEKDDWSGGDTYFVSLGDLLDRGAESRKVIDLVMKLQRQASKQGGQVIQVLGNHELMVVTGDLRYVSKAEFSAFAKDETKKQRKELLAYFKLQNPNLSKEEVAQQFEEAYPVGYGGFVKAFSPNGVYGKWLRKAAHVVKVNDSVFVHGGLSYELNGQTLEEINSITDAILEYQDIVENLTQKKVLPLATDYWTRLPYLQAYLAPYVEGKNKKKLPKWVKDYNRLIELDKSFAFSDESPMWHRGNAYCHPYSESFNVERILKQLSAERVVIGHSPRFKHITSRFNNQVVLADTGMLEEVYRGNATALVIQGGDTQTFTLGDEGLKTLPQEKTRYSLGSNSMTDEEIEEFLLTGNVIDSKSIGTGITKPKVVTLEKDGKTIRAIHKVFTRTKNAHRDSQARGVIYDSYQNEIAAYRLDRLLGLNQVPVAVERKVEGSNTGLMQYWVEDLISETKREKEGIEFDSYCPQLQQFRTRFIFDILIYNDDRNDGNITYSKDGHILHLIDHTISFSTANTRPKMYQKASLLLSNEFRRKLESLNRDVLEEELSGVLNSRQIAAILKRRDLILKSAVSP